MAFPFGAWFLLVSISLAFLSMSVSSTRLGVKATSELIDKVCSGTHNPSLCVQVLKSDPRSSSADLKDLCQISIDSAQATAKSNYNLIGLLAKQTNDLALKGRYMSCYQNYATAIGSLAQAKWSFSSADYGRATSHVFAAWNDPDTCNKNFAGPPAEPPQLQQANQKLEDLCNIILVISSGLTMSN